MQRSLVGSVMCIRARSNTVYIAKSALYNAK
jgi:hypothetical protein